jgi:vesicle-fusing ATPase
MPFGGMGLPGSNPRAPPREKQYSDAQGGPHGRADPYGANQGYRDTDPRIGPPVGRSGGGGGGGGYDPGRSSGMARQGDTGGSAPRGSARQVPLRVEKVPDKSLSDRLIFSNL